MNLSEIRLPWFISGLSTQIRLLWHYPSIQQAEEQFRREKHHRRILYKPSEPIPELPVYDIANELTVIINAYGVEQIARRQNRIPVPIEQTR